LGNSSTPVADFTLAPHPLFQSLGPLIHLVSLNLIARAALAFGGSQPLILEGSGAEADPFDQACKGQFSLPFRSIQRVC
jgi:hypothetical protein